MKKCIKCGGVEFYSSGQCKKCTKELLAKRYAEDPKKYIERALRWQAENKEKVAARKKLYREKNKERERAYSKTSYARSMEIHPDYNRIRHHNRDSRISKNGGVLSKGLSEKLYRLQFGKCACCGKSLGKDYHLDHIMPIVLGGANEDWNIQLLRGKCNLEKNRKHPIDFMQLRGFLL